MALCLLSTRPWHLFLLLRAWCPETLIQAGWWGWAREDSEAPPGNHWGWLRSHYAAVSTGLIQDAETALLWQVGTPVAGPAAVMVWLTVSAKTPKGYKLESGVNWGGVGDHAAGSANISLCHISYILLIHCLKETLHLSAHLSQVSPVLKYRRGYIILFDCEYIILYRFWGMNFTSCRIWPFDIKLLERAQIKIQTNKQTNKQNPNTLVLALCYLLWASHFTS